ncbi:TldD protein [Halobiforma haloterrestris]|uniref:TldD protein n=1 Tax=Natronobacterium haloterrestre TaxID=148448 RepID=A0A1I1HXY3_NATHA|nr:metallopeptidase TldD-related protein [Halobiforma haloterrestris]SFC26838.1 TldD protein [Halobiforma haloterrestris]
MSERGDVVEAVDELLTILESDDEVSFAEVGGITRNATEVVVTETGVRSDSEWTTTGVWCRVFAGGSAAYRFTSDLSSNALSDAASRATTGGNQLAQSAPERVDVESSHRGVHDGWARESVTDRSLSEKRASVEAALEAVETPLDRARITYADERVDHSIATTADSVVRTTVDRASVDATVAPVDGPKLRRHHGSTRGAALLDRLPNLFAEIDRDASTIASAATADPPSGPTTVVLSPSATGQLCHEIGGYLAADVAAFGFSPFEPGDRVTDAPLTIDDGIRPGSWAATAYDAEARPTTPVRLVDQGRVESFLHDTTTAAKAEEIPAGNVIPAIGFEQAPRIHHRHLNVHAGAASRDELLADADVYVRRFGPAFYRDEFERTQRNGAMPPSSLYAHDVAERMGDCPDAGTVELPIAEGFLVEDGELGPAVDSTVVWTADALETIDGIGETRSTVTGVASKHKSRLPYAVTAPAIRLDVRCEN